MTPKSTYIFFYILTLIGLIHSLPEDDTLLSVVQVFRHGARTPALFYPTDPYKDSSYWDGLNAGQLTDYGKIQMVKLGQYFRNRYTDFLSLEYSEDEIYVSSVDTERNYLSAESFLSGLYPNNSDSIPIHEISMASMGNLIECLKYDLLYVEQELEDDYFRNITKENSEVYVYVRNNSGFPVLELLSAYIVWDTLEVESGYGYTLPEWTNSVFPEKLTILSHIFASSICYTEEQQQLISGVFLNELITHFEGILSSPPSAEKVKLYSAHDLNIACFLNTFQAFVLPHIPDFASSLIFELRSSSGNNYVNAYYKQNKEAVPINIRGCDFNCGFEEFKEIFENIRLTELQWVLNCYPFLSFIENV